MVGVLLVLVFQFFLWKNNKLPYSPTLSDKPVIKDLPERTIVTVGALAILPCKVIEDPEISVAWSKDGNTSIPRAQFENDGRILAIKDVLPRDSGVYECKASNKFGESRTATILIVAGNMKWLH